MKVMVLGAGIVGVTTAYFLARAGHEVTVVDQNGAAAEGASHANGGFLSPSYCGPWAAPGVPAMAVKALFHAQAPIRWRPDFTTRQFVWLLAMLRECTAKRFAVNRRRMLALGLYSAQCLDEVEQATGLTYARQRTGILQLCYSAAAHAAARQQGEKLRAGGIDAALLDRDQLIALEPALARRSDLTGALRLTNEGSGRCEHFARALATRLEREGVRFLWNTKVGRINVLPASGGAQGRGFDSVQVQGQALQADACIVAAGVAAPALLREHLSIPVYPVKGFSMTARVTDPQRAPQHAVLDPVHQLAIARFGDVVRVAGYADVVGHDLTLDADRCEQIAATFQSLYPGAADTGQAQFWTGLRPTTPDGTPIIGATAIPGLYVNTGHGSYGWTLSCGSAKLLADIVGGGPPSLPPEDYALARYGHAP